MTKPKRIPTKLKGGPAKAPPVVSSATSRSRAAAILAAAGLVAGAQARILTEGEVVPIPRISSGSIALDHLIGGSPEYGWGLPKGRLVELYGPESSGKTTVALATIAQAQRLGQICAFVDAEHAADLTYFRRVGVDTESLIFSQPDFGEAGLELVEKLATQSVDVIVVDSVAALLPKAVRDGTLEDSHYAPLARLMSQAMSRLDGIASASGTLVIFINQIREKIGVVFGNPNTTPGGRSLKFFASVRLEVKPAGKIESGGVQIGHEVSVKVAKNKVGPPLGAAVFPLLWGIGVDWVGEILELGFYTGIVERNGSWYSYKGERIGNGREAARRALLDPESGWSKLLPEIEARVRAGYGVVK